MGRRALSVLLLAAGLAACDASLMETRHREKGPVAEVGIIDPGAGSARYAKKGPDWLVARRRARAFRLIAKYCGGDKLYRVTAERDKDVSETPYNKEDLDAEELLRHDHYKVESYRLLDFECVKP